MQQQSNNDPATPLWFYYQRSTSFVKIMNFCWSDFLLVWSSNCTSPEFVAFLMFESKKSGKSLKKIAIGANVEIKGCQIHIFIQTWSKDMGCFPEEMSIVGSLNFSFSFSLSFKFFISLLAFLGPFFFLRVFLLFVDGGSLIFNGFWK